MDPQPVIDQYDAFVKSLYNTWQKQGKKKSALSDMLSKKDTLALDGITWGSSQVPSRYISKLEREEAAPFIRAVVERILDLLESEEHWVKNMAAATATGTNVRPESDQADKWCLLGVIARAQHDLRLAQDVYASKELNEARGRVCSTVSYFFSKVMDDDHHMAIPTWNDHPDTTFEDVRLWLKTLCDHLDDVSV